MTLDALCAMAARYADRADEFVKTPQTSGPAVYTGEALRLFTLFRDAINEAYADIARTALRPYKTFPAVLPASRVIAVNALCPEAEAVRGVFSADGVTQRPFRFNSRFDIEVIGGIPGERLTICAAYVPEPLTALTDEPEFPDSVADPMIYVALAVTRLWQSERKLTAAQAWMAEYCRLMRGVKSSPRGSEHRFPRPRFR